MSWEQDYAIPSEIELLEKLTGVTALDALLLVLAQKNIKIVDKKITILDDDAFSGKIEGEQITLSDGRIFVPKLTERHTSGGNYGVDIYTWKEKDEEVEVKEVDEDEEHSYGSCGEYLPPDDLSCGGNCGSRCGQCDE